MLVSTFMLLVWLLLFVFCIGGKPNCLEVELLSLCSKYCNKSRYWLLNLYKYASMFPETEILLKYKNILLNNTLRRRINVRSVNKTAIEEAQLSKLTLLIPKLLQVAQSRRLWRRIVFTKWKQNIKRTTEWLIKCFKVFWDHIEFKT